MAARPEHALARLRPMRGGDVDAVIAIERRAYPNPWSAGIFHDCMRVGYLAWVVEEGPRVAGYGLMSIAAGEAHVLNLCVDPARQRHGLGRRLLDHLLRLAAQRGARTVYLEVRPSNAAALELYRRAGFGEIGHRRDYYPDGDGREDAVVLSLDLD